MRKFAIILLVTTLKFSFAYGQGCSLVSFSAKTSSGNTNGRKDTAVCKNSSMDLYASIPALKQTSAYTVSSIPFIDTLPCESVGSIIGGAGINQDDQYSSLQSIGFNFCFYSSMYSQVAICDNGFLTFNTSSASGTGAPFTAETLPLLATSSIPANSILGAMMDVLVATNYTPPGGGTISVQTVGVSPFRAFIVKYNDCRYFTTSCRTNSAVRLNMKIVLYETTNMIDIYIKTKPICSSGTMSFYNSTQGIVGPNKTTQWLASPGRNNSLWNGATTAYRYTPNGTSNTATIQWTKAGTVISSANTVNITASDDSAFYVATATINSTCPSTTLVVKDSIKVYGITNTVSTVNHYDTIYCKDSILLNAGGINVNNYRWDNTTTSSTRFAPIAGKYYCVRYYDSLGCNRDTIFFNVIKYGKLKIDSFQRSGCFNSSSTGQIKLFVSGDTLYSLFGMTNSPSSRSNIIGNQQNGISTYWVRNAGNCRDSIAIQNDSLKAVKTKRNNLCTLDSSGMLRLSVSGGYSPFTYLLTGRSSQLNDSFNGLGAGIYTISVTDKVGCTVSAIDTIIPFTNLSLTIYSDSAKCFGGNSGKIFAILSGGKPGYQYSINNGPFIGSGTFINLVAGNYSVKTKDSAKCSIDTNIQVKEYPSIQANVTRLKNCPFNSNGSFTLGASGGNPPYLYQLNTGAFQSANTFSFLQNGIYTISVKDANNCIKSLTDTIFSHPKPDVTLLSKKDLSCYGSNDGKIKVQTTNGTPTYTYGWTSPIGSTVDSVQGLAIGTYQVIVTDINTCKDTLVVNIIQPDSLKANFNLYHPRCFNQTNGSIKVLPYGGTAPYVFSLNGGSYGSLDSFSILSDGVYTIRLKDANNCSTLYNKTLINPSKLGLNYTIDSVSCFGGANGKLSVAGTGGTLPYKYKLSTTSFNDTGKFNGLISTTVLLTIKDTNQCTLDSNIFIPQYTALGSTISIIDTIRCKNGADGKISIVANGGKSPYVYSINGGGYQSSNIFSGLNKGKKYINIKDANNCVRVDSIILPEPAGITSNLSILNHVKCYGQQNAKARITVVGGTLPYSYFWDNGITIDSNTTLNSNTHYVKILDARNCSDSISFSITQPDSLRASIALYHPKCYNLLGSLKINAVGGTLPYQYSFNSGSWGSLDSFYNLTGTIYTIQIRDLNLCSRIYYPILTTPSPIQASYAVDSVKCFGGNSGKITVSATGGTGVLKYKKNGIIQPSQVINTLIAGTYTIQVFDSNGCFLDSNISVYQYSDLNLTTIHDTVWCYGANSGSIVATITGGAGNYTYSLDNSTYGVSNTFSGLLSGTHIIKVKDGYSCVKTLNEMIPQKDSILISPSLIHNPCFSDAKGIVKLNLSGGTSPYMISFQGGAYNSVDSFSNLVAGSYSYSVKDAKGCIKSGVLQILQPTKLGLNVQVDSVHCYKVYDGKIQIIPNGGIPNYQYSLNGGTYTNSAVFSNLSDGAYLVRVRDNNACGKDTTVNLYSPDSLYANYTLDSLKCFNQTIGKILIQPVGGKPSYTYSLNGGAFQTFNSFSNLPSGTYNIITKDEYNCQLSHSFTLLNPTAITIQLDSLKDNKCNGFSLGKIQINSFGGRIPHTYSWSNGVTSNINQNLPAGNYTVTVKDANGCENINTYNVLQPTPISFAVNKRDLRCYGDVDAYIRVNVTGGIMPYWYKWSIDSTTPSISNLIAGTYVLTVTDGNGCIVTRTMNITEPFPISFSLSKLNSSCEESDNGVAEVINLQGGSPPFTYVWSSGAKTSKSSGLKAFNSYYVTVSDANACFRIDSAYVDTSYKLRVGIDYISSPRCPNSPVSFKLIPENGSTPYEYKVANNINDSGSFYGIPNAIYSIKVLDGNGCLYENLVDMIPKDTLVVKLKNYIPLCETSNIWSSKLNVTGGSPPYIYSWPGSYQIIGSGDSALHNIRGNYEVTVRDSFCSVTKKFLLSPPDSALSGNILPMNLRCYELAEGKMTALAAGGTPPYRYNWSNGQTTLTADNLSAHTLYSLTITDAENCKYIVYDTLSQPDSLGFIYKKRNLVCNSSLNGSIVITPFGGTAPLKKYTYSLDSQLFQSEYYFLPLKNGRYRIRVKDENECIASDNIDIDVENQVEVQLDSIYQTSLGNQIVLNPTLNLKPPTNPYILKWIPSEGLSCSDCLNPSFNGYISTQYSLIVHYGEGCTDSFHTKVLIKELPEEFYVPTAFSPRADKEENRKFRAYGNHILKYNLKIFNRVGEKVFETNQIQNGWDGYYKDELVPYGVYNYYIEAQTLDQRKIFRTGSLTFYY